MLKIFPIKVIAFFLLVGIISFSLGISTDIPEQKIKQDFSLIVREPAGWGTFCFLFLNNFKVGLMIAILGFMTGGIASFVIFTWNGYTLGLLVSSVYATFKTPESIVLQHILPHATTEVLAFCLFGCIGFKGIYFFAHVIQQSELSIRLLPKVSHFFIPIFLLIISAFLEAFISAPN